MGRTRICRSYVGGEFGGEDLCCGGSLKGRPSSHRVPAMKQPPGCQEPGSWHCRAPGTSLPTARRLVPGTPSLRGSPYPQILVSGGSSGRFFEGVVFRTWQHTSVLVLLMAQHVSTQTKLIVDVFYWTLCLNCQSMPIVCRLFFNKRSSRIAVG